MQNNETIWSKLINQYKPKHHESHTKLNLNKIVIGSINKKSGTLAMLLIKHLIKPKCIAETILSI